jgi:hypothetical protein
MSLLDAAGVVTGDIWCSGAFSFESPLKDLLDSGRYTLEQLLSEDELLQELRGVHPQLIQFLSTEAAVTGLVKYVTLPPNGRDYATADGLDLVPASSMVSEALTANESDDEEKASAQNTDQQGPTQSLETEIENEQPPGSHPKHMSQSEKDALFVRYPYMSCEVICCEINDIIDLLVDGFVPATMDSSDKSADGQGDPRRSILDLLFDMLFDAEAGEIDDYRAGYFDKILSVLFRKRPQALADYINTGGRRGQAALMNAMFKHLYSHSIMQIVQRLLLPQPPLPPTEDDDEDKEGAKSYMDSLEGADVDGFGAFRCTWPDSDEAMKALLDCLIEKSPYPEIEQNEEMRLSMYQNASEVLITIIQNSPLTSPRLHSLTTDPVLDRLIRAATTEQEGEPFSPHDSRQTCTMNVLESLILQLGGYGSVVTMMYPDDEEDLGVGEDGEGNLNTDEPASRRVESAQEEMATSETLISHLPFMLSNLCYLLLHPAAEHWTSPMQYSKSEPQNVLGSSRLRIVRLLESLVLLGDPDVDSKLCESNCLEACLDLFWKFQWCSMLHQSVANLLVHVFEGANTRAELQAYFLVKCNLLGRLLSSFWEETDNMNSSDAGAVTGKKADKAPSSVTGENGSNVGEEVSADSDDDGENDVDGSPDDVGPIIDVDSSPPVHTPPQSFRLGYMGHVIIICQALVHACSNEGMDPNLEETNDFETNVNGEYAPRQNEEGGEAKAEEGKGAQPDKSERFAIDDTVANPLILAQLVETHQLRRQWEAFVQSTLASETAIQSTPLGGFPGAGLGDMDPLHAHRPGLAEDDEYDDDDVAAPPLPPRGLLVGGEVIDMDDNDLDVAASMMAGLTMGRGEGGGRGHQDLLAGIPQQSGDGASSGYMFEDPLGDGRFGRFDSHESEDSSDEESDFSAKSGDSGGAVADGVSGSTDNTPEAPVMDLFAGNFEAFDSDQGRNSNDGGGGGDWSDFANFDNAFAGANGDVADVDDPFEEDPKEKMNISDIFGQSQDRSALLEAMEDPVGARSTQDDTSSSDEDPVPADDMLATS